MDHQNCPNCETPLSGKPFCAECGLKQPVHRITLRHFFHEVFHAVTHADKGILHLLRSLATKPGTVAREYIAGKRKKYFNPFTFFLIVMGLFVLSNTLFKKAPVQRQPDPRVLSYIPSAEGKAKYIATMNRVNKSTTFFYKNGNIVAMIAIPFIALITWSFYRRKKFNYAEHLTAMVLFVAFSNLLFSLTIFPLQTIFPGTTLLIIGLLLQALYMWWSINGFLQLRTPGARTGSLFVSLFSILAWSVFSMVAMAVYIYQSWDFYKFFTRMG